ncbi:Transcriptional activator HAP2 [Abortiporus biennis]
MDSLFSTPNYHNYQQQPQQQQQQQQLYNFFPHPSRQPSPQPNSPHALFLPQQQQSEQQPPQQQRDHETSVDQIQDDQPIDEEPLYVNAKQYYRILKRRVARARLEEVHRLSRQRKPYLHESRHRHAMRRPRGPGGRFLTAEEIAAQKLQSQPAGPSASNSQDGDEDDADRESDIDVDMMTPDNALTPPHIKSPLVPPLDNKPRTTPIIRAAPSSLSSQPPPLQPRPVEDEQHKLRQIPLSAQQLTPLQPHHPPPNPPDSNQHSQQQPQSHQTHHHVHPHPHMHSQFSLGLNSASVNLSHVAAFHQPISHPGTPVPHTPTSVPTNPRVPDRIHLDHEPGGRPDLSQLSAMGHHHLAHESQPSIAIARSQQQQQQQGQNPTPPAVTLRSPYAAMQMHHVPHPHAHARHHHSYVNQAQGLYGEDENNCLFFSSFHLLCFLKDRELQHDFKKGYTTSRYKGEPGFIR